jgi:hypothetical protein
MGRVSFRAVPHAALAALLLFAGCVTPGQRAAQMQAEVERMMAVYGPACVRLGYAPGSDAWRNCVLSLDRKNDLQRLELSGPYDGWGPGYWHGGWGRRW